MTGDEKAQAGVRPTDPEAAARYAEMLEGAASCFLLYQSFIEAGFTEGQAIQLVGVTLGGQR
ncbi:MAG: hypothetical protein BWY85_00737 [Firmicutes bacterium ADurb.Bin506]|nr:MAG: hypothetical protein BWY85_00737 [Firmicutes bacterium ADurb.Bin506]